MPEYIQTVFCSEQEFKEFFRVIVENTRGRPRFATPERFNYAMVIPSPGLGGPTMIMSFGDPSRPSVPAYVLPFTEHPLRGMGRPADGADSVVTRMRLPPDPGAVIQFSLDFFKPRILGPLMDGRMPADADIGRLWQFVQGNACGPMLLSRAQPLPREFFRFG